MLVLLVTGMALENLCGNFQSGVHLSQLPCGMAGSPLMALCTEARLCLSVQRQQRQRGRGQNI